MTPPQAPTPPTPLTPDWYAVQLANAEAALANAEAALAVKALAEYRAWREMVGIVSTLRQLASMAQTADAAAAEDEKPG